MSNPFAATRKVTGRQSATPLEQFVNRIRALGATDDEVAGVVENWDQLDEDWTAERRGMVLAMGDGDLQRLLAEGREEYDFSTTTEGEAAQAATRAYLAVYADATEQVAGTVASVLAWVGDDPVRAQAAIDAEKASDHADRSTLLGPLADLLGQ